jgi:hypothetical protein
MFNKFCTNEEAMAMERIQPKHQDASLLFKGGSIDDLRTLLLDFKEPKLRPYVGLFSQEYEMAVKILANCFRKMKTGRKRGVFVFTCCYVFWFGAKPDPCLHIIDESFRSMHDYRSYASKQVTTEASTQGIKDMDDDMMSMMTLDDLDGLEDKDTNEALEKLVSSMMKKYAKRCGLLDEVYGFITLPAVVCTSHSRPESKVHIRCFWSGGPNAEISAAEQRDIDLRVSALHIVEKLITSKEAEQIVIEADNSYEMCTGKLSEMLHLSVGFTDEVCRGTQMVFEKVYGRLPYELGFLDQATYGEEWEQYESRFWACKAAYEEMVKRHHHKRGVFWQYWLKYRDIEYGDEKVESLRKKTIAREIIDLCIDKAFETMKPKLNKQWTEQLKPYVKIIKKKKTDVLRQRQRRANKNEKNKQSN